jgi:hypothetical protein
LFASRVPAPDFLRDVATIVLSSLDADSAGRLIDSLIASGDRSASEGERAALLVRGGGSPLFLREIVRQWILTGSADHLPTSLTTLFDAGVAGLSASGLRALQAAAVLGSYATL